MDIWVVSHFWLLWTVLLWTCTCVFLSCIPWASEKVVLNKYWLKEWLEEAKAFGPSRVVWGWSYALPEGARAGWRIEALALEGDQHMQRPRAGCILGTGEADGGCWGSGNRKLHEEAGGGGRDQDSRTLSFTDRSLDSLLRQWGAMERLWAMKSWLDLTWVLFNTAVPQRGMDSGAWSLEWQKGDPRYGHCPHPGEGEMMVAWEGEVAAEKEKWWTWDMVFR